MPTTRRSFSVCSLGIALMLTHAVSAGAAPARLAFDVEEGRNLNSFLREGPVAAHLVLRSGSEPRILVAFPAGNSGIAVWFERAPAALTWTLLGAPQPLQSTDEHGRPLYGMSAQVRATGADALTVRQALLSSVRVLRDFQALGTFPPQLAVAPRTEGSSVRWARDRLDGAPGYRLGLDVLEGSLSGTRVTASARGIVFKITALCGETPLTPLPEADLLNEKAAADPAARHALSFLSYREKFLAGSWRFNTYFGRDTLMSVRLLMPALTSAAVDAGIGAVLSRLSAQGEVAHEEDIGEFAILDHERTEASRSAAPVFDYKMIDSTYMLAPVAAAWLLDDPRGRGEAEQFLARSDARAGETRRFGADLVANLSHVLRATAAFSSDPRPQNLIALKSGVDVGQWRDSNDGLAGGRYPYDVNAVFVPAALEAAGRFYASGLLDPYLKRSQRADFARAAVQAEQWRAHARPFFEVSIANEAARQAVAAYAANLQIPAAAALDAIGTASVHFPALALDGALQPIDVLHSDEGFDLLFGQPSAAAVKEAVTAVLRPFPAGLLTPVGMLVANPGFASPTVQAKLTSSAYHGTVVWSWQQAVFAAGLARQLQRPDLPQPLRETLHTAQAQLWSAIRAARTLRNSELWSWRYAHGRFEIAPFGAQAADADESNAAQLWSTVYLAIPEPAPRR